MEEEEAHRGDPLHLRGVAGAVVQGLVHGAAAALHSAVEGARSSAASVAQYMQGVAPAEGGRDVGTVSTLSEEERAANPFVIPLEEQPPGGAGAAAAAAEEEEEAKGEGEGEGRGGVPRVLEAAARVGYGAPPEPEEEEGGGVLRRASRAVQGLAERVGGALAGAAGVLDVPLEAPELVRRSRGEVHHEAGEGEVPGSPGGREVASHPLPAEALLASALSAAVPGGALPAVAGPGGGEGASVGGAAVEAGRAPAPVAEEGGRAPEEETQQSAAAEKEEEEEERRPAQPVAGLTDWRERVASVAEGAGEVLLGAGGAPPRAPAAPAPAPAGPPGADAPPEPKRPAGLFQALVQAVERPRASP